MNYKMYDFVFSIKNLKYNITVDRFKLNLSTVESFNNQKRFKTRNMSPLATNSSDS